MGASRTLLRKLDLDLIERMESGGKPLKHNQPKKYKPRSFSSYRGARRNAAARGEWIGVEAEAQGWDVTELNRSKNLPPANSYKHAAEIAAKRKLLMAA